MTITNTIWYQEGFVVVGVGSSTATQWPQLNDLNSMTLSQWPRLDVLAFWAANQVAYWLSVSPGRWGWIWVGIPQQAFFSGLTVIGAVNIIGAINDLVPIYTVVQHWLLATNRDCIAVGLSLSLHPCSEIVHQYFMETHASLEDPTQTAIRPLHQTVSVTLISPEKASSVEKIGTSHPAHCTMH